MKAYYHLPGLFEYYEFYKKFLPIFYSHKEYFYDDVEIGSIYGVSSDCIWSGGRVGGGEVSSKDVIDLMNQYNIPSRLTLSNALLTNQHLNDLKSNKLVEDFMNTNILTGIIIHSDLLLEYLKENYPGYYYISSTTKVITNKDEILEEIRNNDYKYVVLDYRYNHNLEFLNRLNDQEKEKIELLCNECCDIRCNERKACYENVSHINLGHHVLEHVCPYTDKDGYKFSDAMKNPSFISRGDIQDVYLPMGINQFKIEGRGLGTAILLEFILYYLVKPEYHLILREAIYLDSMLDLF